MINQIVLYIASASITFWGIAHLFPTANIVRDFGEISADSRNIITMEWLIEGAALIFMGVLVATITTIDPFNPVSTAVYWLTFGMLNILSIISLLTGFKVRFFTFRLCPLIFSGASLLILWGLLA
jgi:hypothetical protein